VSRQIKITIRSAYGLLDFFGDIGGLIDALYYFVAVLFYPYWSFVHRSFLLTKLFATQSKPNEAIADQKDNKTAAPTALSQLKQVFNPLIKINSMNFLTYKICLCYKKRQKYSTLLR